MEDVIRAIKKKFEVIEDSGGGITLFVFDEDGNVEYAHDGYEYHAGQLRKDLKELSEGSDPMVEDWDGCFENPQWLYEYYTSAEYGWEVVADNDGIYPEKMMGLDVGAEFNIDFDEFYDKLYRRALR